MQKLTKHDRYVNQLVSQIENEYDYISTNLKITNKKRTVAEVDVIARKGREIHFYEVKCSYRITKAKKQLRKLRKMFNDKRISCYFYCGSGDKLVQVN